MTFSLVSKSPLKNHVIPNGVREVKNPSSISIPPPLGSLPSETPNPQLPTPNPPEAK
jgi:hypothetical protein